MLRPIAVALGGVAGLILMSSPAAAQNTNEPVSEASVVVAASPFSPVNDRIISDPLFLPAKGRFYGSSGYSLSLPVSSSYNNLGVKKSEHHGHDNEVSQTLAYGFSRTLSVHLNISYDWNSNDSTSESTGATSIGSSRGLNNPTIGVTYRAIDQAKGNPVNVDFTADYLPDLIASQTGGTPKAGGAKIVGTASSGRSAVALNAGVGRVMRDFTIQATGSANHLGTRHYSSLASGDVLTQDSGWSYSVGLRSQIRPTKRLSINLNLTYTFSDDRHSKDLTTALAWTAQEPRSLTVGTGVNYHLIRNRLVGSLTYSHHFRGDSADIYVNPNSNVFTRDSTSDTVGLRLQYTLN